MTDLDDAPASGTQCVALHASVLLRVVLGLFVPAAAAALGAGLAPFVGVTAAVVGAGVVALLLAVFAHSACTRCLPAKLRLDAGGGLAAFDRAGRLLAQGRVAGCLHWSDLLVVLAVRRNAGRTVSLVIPVDALDSRMFRVLSVLGRRASRSGLESA